MRLLALDLAPRTSGYATLDDGQVHTGLIVSRHDGPAQLGSLLRSVIDLCDTLTPQLVLLEGFAYGKPNQAHQIGEAHGVVKLWLFEARISTVTIPPAQLKKFATGKGQAAKDVVLQEAVRRFDRTFSRHDEADALWMAAMAAQRFGEPIVAMPKERSQVVAKMEWPPLDNRRQEVPG